MVKGLYAIHDVEASKQAKKADTSYKSCLLTMFIVFLICVIIFLLLWKTKAPSRSYSPDYNNDAEKFEKLKAQQPHGTSPLYEDITEDTTQMKTTTTKRSVSPSKQKTKPTTTTQSHFAKLVVTSTTPATTSTQASTTTQATTATTTIRTPAATQTQTITPLTTTQQSTTITKKASHGLLYGHTNSTSTTQASKDDSLETVTETDTDVDYLTSDSDSETIESHNVHNQTSDKFVALGSSTSTVSSTSTLHGGHLTSTTSTTYSSQESTTTSSNTTTNTASTSSNTTTNTASTSTVGALTTVPSLSSGAQTSSTASTKVMLMGIQNSTNTETTSESTTVAGSYSDTSDSDSSVPISVTRAQTRYTSTTHSTQSSTMATNGTTVTVLNNSSSTTPSPSVNWLHTTTNMMTTSSDSETTDDDVTGSTIPPEFPAYINDTEGRKICDTSECKALSSRILSLMNHSIDPCDNFYEFACGGLRGNPTLLQDNPHIDIWSRISRAVDKVSNRSNQAHQKFRQFYGQCVKYEDNLNKTERLNQARKVVLDVDKMYNKVQWETRKLNFSLTHALVKLFKLDSTPLFDVLLDVDTYDPSKFELKLTLPPRQTKLQLESPMAARCKSDIVSDNPHTIDLEDVYTSKYHPCMRHFAEYMKTLEEAVKEFDLFDNTKSFNISQMITEVRISIEVDLFSIFENVEEWKIKSDVLEKKFKLVTIEELNTEYPGLQWDVLFCELLGIDSIDKDTAVQVYFQDEYFNRLFDHVKYAVANDSAMLVLYNSLLAMLAHDLYVDLVKPRPCNREEYCLKLASGLMEDISSSLYLSTFTTKELNSTKNELETLFGELKDVLRDDIEQANWLDEPSRSAIVNKLDKMIVRADGGIENFNNPSYLNNVLGKEDLKPENSFLENCIELQRRYRDLLYNTFGSDPSDSLNIWTFFLLPYDFHPSFVYQLNTVIIPYGLVGSWKRTDNIPDYVFKARIGNEIARQIVHHFDAEGIQYDVNTKDSNFITKDNYTEAYEECEHMIDNTQRSWTNQYKQNYEYKTNALRTMNEHISDNGALWLAHKLFNLTAEKEPLLPWLDPSHSRMYYLLAAQEMCAKEELLDYTVTMFESSTMPPHLRVDNMIKNSPVFGYVYKCGRGSNQNPDFKCYPFPQVEEPVDTGPAKAVGSF